jgi:hypothetical protein
MSSSDSLPPAAKGEKDGVVAKDGEGAAKPKAGDGATNDGDGAGSEGDGAKAEDVAANAEFEEGNDVDDTNGPEANEDCPKLPNPLELFPSCMLSSSCIMTLDDVPKIMAGAGAETELPKGLETKDD